MVCWHLSKKLKWKIHAHLCGPAGHGADVGAALGELEPGVFVRQPAAAERAEFAGGEF